MNTMSFYEFRSEQTGSGSRSYIFKENKIIPSKACFINVLRIYLNEKLDFCHHIIERNAQSLIKKLTDINRCLTNPADQCLTDINRYYISYSTYPVLVILNL